MFKVLNHHRGAPVPCHVAFANLAINTLFWFILCEMLPHLRWLRSYWFLCMVQFWCQRAHWRQFRQWTGVSMGIMTSLRLHSSICNKLQCTVFWHLSIRTSMNLFSNLSYSSLSVGSDHIGQPLIPTCIDEPWLLRTLSLVTCFSILVPLYSKSL